MRLFGVILVSIMFPEVVHASTMFDPAYVCKAAIATLNGHKLKGTTELIDQDTYSLKYTRKDGKKVTYWCKFEGQKVTWPWGVEYNIRWRDEYMGGKWNENFKLSYPRMGASLVITAVIKGKIKRRAF